MVATQQGPSAILSNDPTSGDCNMDRTERTLAVSQSSRSDGSNHKAHSRRRLSRRSFGIESPVLDPKLSDDEAEDEDYAKDRVSMFEDRNLSAAASAASRRKINPQSTKKSNPFLGAPYSKREYAYAICVGVLLSFNAGYVNGSCLSGLVAPSGTERAVTSHTGTTSKSALALSGGNTSEFGFLVSMLLCYSLGSFIAGSLTPKPKKAFRIEASYGPTFLIGAAFLTISSSLAAMEVEQEQFIFYLASAANGIQNGISSIYSKNLIRSTGVTGTTTDIGIFLGQLLRGNRANTWKLIVLLCLFASFWLGGLVSLFATNRFLHFSLLFNAGLYTLIGGSVVWFLHGELQVSWGQALFGEKLEIAFEEQDSKEPKSTRHEDSSFCSPSDSHNNPQPERPWWAGVPTDIEC